MYPTNQQDSLAIILVSPKSGELHHEARHFLIECQLLTVRQLIS